MGATTRKPSQRVSFDIPVPRKFACIRLQQTAKGSCVTAQLLPACGDLLAAVAKSQLILDHPERLQQTVERRIEGAKLAGVWRCVWVGGHGHSIVSSPLPDKGSHLLPPCRSGRYTAGEPEGRRAS